MTTYYTPPPDGHDPERAGERQPQDPSENLDPIFLYYGEKERRGDESVSTLELTAENTLLVRYTEADCGIYDHLVITVVDEESGLDEPITVMQRPELIEEVLGRIPNVHIDIREKPDDETIRRFEETIQEQVSQLDPSDFAEYIKPGEREFSGLQVVIDPETNETLFFDIERMLKVVYLDHPDFCHVAGESTCGQEIVFFGGEVYANAEELGIAVKFLRGVPDPRIIQAKIESDS